MINKDDDYFGPRGEPGGQDAGYYKFGEVRNLPTAGKYRALKLRLDHFLIQQFDRIYNKLRNSINEPDTPQALALLTCTAIAAIGKIFYYQVKNHRKEFLEACKAIDVDFNTSWQRNDLRKFILVEQGQSPNSNRVLTHGDTLYTGYRCAFVHSYSMVGVTLNNAQKQAWKVNSNPYSITLSPGYFWELVKVSYIKIWNDVQSDPNDARIPSLHKYLSKLLEIDESQI